MIRLFLWVIGLANIVVCLESLIVYYKDGLQFM